jgi:xanthine/uracil permease
LLAPITIGPQAGCLLALAVGEKRLAAFLSLSLGAIPWCIAFAVIFAMGFKLAF